MKKASIIILNLMLVSEIIIFFVYSGKPVVENARLFYSAYFKKSDVVLDTEQAITRAWIKQIPPDENIIFTGSAAPWLINYYLFPRKLYFPPCQAGKGWLNQRNIKWKITYNGREPGSFSVSSVVK